MFIKTKITYEKYALSIFELASADKQSQDDYLVQALPNRLRVAAIDGATPVSKREIIQGVGTAVFGASAVRMALKSELNLKDAFLAANSFLHDSTLPFGSYQAQAAACGCDIMDDKVHFVRSGDCNAYIFDGTSWQELFYNDCISESLRAEYDAWHKTTASLTPEEKARAEEAMLGNPTKWISTALGRFEHPVLNEKTISYLPEKIILVSDGARLNTERVSDLDNWLANLRDWEKENQKGLKPHDDVTVIVLEMAP